MTGRGDASGFDPIVFDLDGTIVDSAPAIVSAMRAACEAVDRPVDPGRDLGSCVGPPLERSLLALLADPDLVPPATEAFRAHYVANLERYVALMPGAAGVLRRLSGSGLTLAVATYKATFLAEAVLAATDLRTCFRAVVGRDPDGDERTKADIVATAIAATALAPGSAVYVGDHHEDAAAARTLGLPFIRFGSVDWPGIERAVMEGPTGPAVVPGLASPSATATVPTVQA